MRRLVVAAALVWLGAWPAAGVAGDAFTAQALLSQLAAKAPMRARFVEERRIGLLDQPLVIEGTLSFSPPDRLIRQDLLPVPAIYRIEGQEVTIQRGTDERHLRLADEPVLAALVLPFRATLAGDAPALERAYTLSVTGDPAAWRLVLVPKDARIIAMLSKIILEGAGSFVDSVTIEERDGDRSVMRLTPAPS